MKMILIQCIGDNDVGDNCSKTYTFTPIDDMNIIFRCVDFCKKLVLKYLLYTILNIQEYY